MQFGTYGKSACQSLCNLQRKPQNKSREPDILTRQCKNCFKVYAGNNRICPYCNFDNGKTKKQIEQEKQAELERITEIKKRQDKNDLKQANKGLDVFKKLMERSDD